MNYKSVWYSLCFVGSSAALSACGFFSPPSQVPDKINPSTGGQEVSNKKDAYQWAKNHRKDVVMYKPSNKKGGKSCYFTNDFIDIMQDQKGCVGLNFYLSQKGDDELGILVVSVDAEGNDLTGEYTNEKNIVNQYIIGETTMRCPYNCDTSSPLYKD